MEDPRVILLKKRISCIERIVPIMSSKGGVGKTVIATVLSLLLARQGHNVGLLDLDITNPSTHVILGVKPGTFLPEEERGIKPVKAMGIEYMSVVFYTGNNPLPLRGPGIDNVIREILAITRWSHLDYLIIDTPPGISDEVLDVMTYISNIEPIIVTTPSPLSVASVERLLKVVSEQGTHVAGLIVNMADGGDAGSIEALARRYGVGRVWRIPFVRELDDVVASGDVETLLSTVFAKKLHEVAVDLSGGSSYGGGG